MDDETFIKLLAEQTKAIRQMVIVNRKTLQYLSPKANVGQGTVSTTGETVFSIPGAGTVFLRILGQGVVGFVKFSDGGQVHNLNQGAVLTSGSMYEFPFKVGEGEILFFVGSSEVRCFWEPE